MVHSYDLKKKGIIKERTMTRPLENPVVGKPCLIQIGTQVFRTSKVIDWFHDFETDLWTISTVNSVYTQE